MPAPRRVPGGDSAGGGGGVGTEASFQPLSGYDYAKPEPLARAPKNVFVFRGKEQQVLGWRNVFDLPIQYDVELCPGLLTPESETLSHRFLPKDGPRRRFVVIGERRESRRKERDVPPLARPPSSVLLLLAHCYAAANSVKTYLKQYAFAIRSI